MVSFTVGHANISHGYMNPAVCLLNLAYHLQNHNSCAFSLFMIHGGRLPGWWRAITWSWRWISVLQWRLPVLCLCTCVQSATMLKLWCLWGVCVCFMSKCVWLFLVCPSLKGAWIYCHKTSLLWKTSMVFFFFFLLFVLFWLPYLPDAALCTQ